MHIKLRFIHAPLVSLFLFAFLITSCTQEAKLSKKPVVVVNDQELSASEFASLLAKKMKRFDAIGAKNPQNIKASKESIIEEFIHGALVNIWAKESAANISEKDLESAASQFRRQYPNDIAMKQALAEEGLTYVDWLEDYKKTLLRQRVFEALKSKIVTPSTDEMKSYYESNKELFVQKAAVRLRQIVVEKEEDADRIYQQMTRSTDLGKLAKQFSITPESSENGDTGWIPKGTLEVFDQAFAWPVGKRSPVLKSPYGYHIYEVIAKRNEQQLKFEDVKDTILRLMMADREQAAYAAWLEDQIKKVRVFRSDDLINSITVVTKGDQ